MRKGVVYTFKSLYFKANTPTTVGVNVNNALNSIMRIELND